MEFWLKKNQCTGCGACSNICPKGAIKMVEDECGFKYPVIDQYKCINCGLCKKTCPILEIQSNDKKIQKVYAAWSKDKDNRFISTSGGMFTELAKEIIKQHGYVVGAAYNEQNMVEHRIVNDLQHLEELRQSKYLQSDTLDIYKDTKKLLDANELVAFCGAPCQIAGLYKYLKKDYSNLLTIEFICRGMNSPKAYRFWLKEIENKENKKITKVWFKYKENGWKKSPKCTRVDFNDGTHKIYNGGENKFMSGYLNSNLYIRPSCGNCQFKDAQRQADIILADFWGITSNLDDDKGTSLVMINSDNGDNYFEKIKNNIYYEERNLEEIYEGNVCFKSSVNINSKSEEFLKKIDDNNFSQMVDKYGKKSFFAKCVGKIKRMLKNKKAKYKRKI